MGDPRKIRPKFRGPGHPWEARRIEEEKKLLKEYGLKTKTEIRKASSHLKTFPQIPTNLCSGCISCRVPVLSTRLVQSHNRVYKYLQGFLMNRVFTEIISHLFL